ncbi:hypothetical protein PENTCL1PPCAC_8738, partial [Pristionchus entomophagus]
ILLFLATAIPIHEGRFSSSLAHEEDSVREMLKSRGLPEPAIEDYLNGRFDHGPFTEEKQHRLKMWYERWAKYIHARGEHEFATTMVTRPITTTEAPTTPAHPSPAVQVL